MSYHDRMIDATVTNGMLIFCDHRKAHEIAREADAEMEALRRDAARWNRLKDSGIFSGVNWDALTELLDGSIEYLESEHFAAIAAKGAGDAN